MTDDPSAALVTPKNNHPAMTTPPDTVTRDAVRAALVDLLTIGQHHHAATPATLTAVGHTRRALTHHHNPAVHDDHEDQRLAALTQALDAVNDALIVIPHPRHPETTELRDGLTELAALALGWLDTLPDPDGKAF
jgi:hypothetical protein